MVPDHMLAARVPVQGGPDFHLDLVPVPEPGPYQILVTGRRVHRGRTRSEPPLSEFANRGSRHGSALAER